MILEKGSYAYIANKELKTANMLKEIGEYDTSLFYAHRALEKIGKAYIELKYAGSELKNCMRSHSLITIYKIIPIKDINLMLETLHVITNSYFNTRYPSIDYFEYTKEDVEKYLPVVIQIFNKVVEEIEKIETIEEF